MKILVVTPHYFPENFKITEIAEELAKKNEVEVWTNIPDYPSRKCYKEKYTFLKNRKQKINNVIIKRLPSTYRGKSLVSQAINYLTFYISCVTKARFVKKRFDLVINNEISPITSIKGGLIVAKRQNIPSINYVLDIWPDCLLTIKSIKPNSIIYKFFSWYSKRIYTLSSQTWITSESFKPFLINMGCIPKTIKYIPNSSSSSNSNIMVVEKDNLIPINKYKIVFAGNVGKAQGLDTLVSISEIAKIHGLCNFVFCIIGDGSYRQTLKNKIDERCVKEYFWFHDPVPMSKVSEFYVQADAFFYSLIKNDSIQRTLPGKVSEYMQYGKPIITDCGGESKIVLDKYGGGVFFENASEAIEKIQHLISGSNTMPINMEYVKNTFSKESVMKKIKDAIEEVMSSSK